MSRIVIADDHEFLRVGLEAILARLGHDVVASVDDGDVALAAIEAESPDLAILDVRMPRKGGVATLESMRAKGDNRPVILLTAELDDAGLIAAIRAKVDAIVFKNTTTAASLKEAIANALAGKRNIDAGLIDRALARVMEKPAHSKLELITAKERQIADAVASGKRNREIAALVGMTENTVKIYLHRIYEKLGVENRTELAVLITSA